MRGDRKCRLAYEQFLGSRRVPRLMRRPSRLTRPAASPDFPAHEAEHSA